MLFEDSRYRVRLSIKQFAIPRDSLALVAFSASFAVSF